MGTLRREVLPIAGDGDVVTVRRLAKKWAGDMGCSLVDQTKVMTAASELARNTLIHGGGGSATVEELDERDRRGLRMTFADDGPGIADIAEAMRDGFTTGSGMGLGLSGSKRLIPDFAILSAPGQGTRVTVTKWR
jgi:serine/threonine-protein kinase RsbT